MSHYFETPTGASDRTVVPLTVDGRRLELLTDRGVFSRDHVDAGTRVLLEVVPPPPSGGDLVDLGCGYGPVAVTLALRSPAATVWAVDTNARARELCAENAAAAGAVGIRVVAPEQVPTGLRVAAIWSNPPIRIGKEALRALLVGWLDRLTPDGAAHLVVDRHLGADSLQRWLALSGWDADRVASRRGFRVLRVRRSPVPPVE